jgi:hypothetical protein
MTPQIHRNPPFRAEHLGSLLPTRELLDAKTAFEDSQLSESDLTVIEKKYIQDIVKKQKELGYVAFWMENTADPVRESLSFGPLKQGKLLIADIA